MSKLFTCPPARRGAGLSPGRKAGEVRLNPRRREKLLLRKRRVEAGEAVLRSFGANLIAPELERFYLAEGNPVWQV
jgi:hypothetical protein